jgi:cyclophilin family peptidyl-prolyl cis-trans isomerase
MPQTLRATILGLAVIIGTTAMGVAEQAKPRKPVQAPQNPAKPIPAAPAFFTTPLTLDEMKGKQAVIETTMGRVVVALLPETAPNHVGYFIKLAGEGAYNGTTFHRLLTHGIIQGGDPLSRDAAKRDQYGTGGLGLLRAEPGTGAHGRGAVSAVLRPGNRDSAGSQFFICVTPQAALDGQFTVFGRVVEGIGVVTKISEARVDESGRATDRIVMTSVVIRDAPPPVSERFTQESPAELAQYRAVLETSLGDITIAFFADKAPNHVRHFLRLALAGVVDGTSFHRVVPGFVIQTGYLGSKPTILDDDQQALAVPQAPEFNDTVHDKGIVSMARGDDPASATTSFFVVTGRAPALDGKYTAFGHVVAGMAVVEAIEQARLNGEAPVERIELRRIRVARLQ